MTDKAVNVGILFADIAGSMKLYDAFGNRGALSAIEMCCGVIIDIVRQNGGRVVKTIGDEVMAAFPDRVRTWTAAVQMQTKIEALAPLPAAQGPIKLGLRIGFNFGQAIANGGDFFGETVNVAARMVQLAKRGQIITAGDGQALPQAGLGFTVRNLDWLPVKGKPDGVQVVEIMWKQDNPAHTTVMDLQSFSGSKQPSNDLRLTFGGKAWLCDVSRPTVTIGREPVNTIVLTNSAASRNHATIERRRDRWVLLDHSSNGTFLASAGQEMHLRHEETFLAETGVIGFGTPPRASPPDCCVTFAIERRTPG